MFVKVLAGFSTFRRGHTKTPIQSANHRLPLLATAHPGLALPTTHSRAALASFVTHGLVPDGEQRWHLVAGVVVVVGGLWHQDRFVRSCEYKKISTNIFLLPFGIESYHHVALVERSSKLLSNPKKVNVEAGNPSFRKSM